MGLEMYDGCEDVDIEWYACPRQMQSSIITEYSIEVYTMHCSNVVDCCTTKSDTAVVTVRMESTRKVLTPVFIYLYGGNLY